MYSGRITAKKLIFSFSNCSTHFFWARLIALELYILDLFFLVGWDAWVVRYSSKSASKTAFKIHKKFADFSWMQKSFFGCTFLEHGTHLGSVLPIGLLIVPIATNSKIDAAACPVGSCRNGWNTSTGTFKDVKAWVVRHSYPGKPSRLYAPCAPPIGDVRVWTYWKYIPCASPTVAPFNCVTWHSSILGAWMVFVLWRTRSPDCWGL